MKVKDLIKELQKLPDDMLVVRPGYEGGVTEITGCGVENIVLNVHDAWWYGEHEYVEDMVDRGRKEDIKEVTDMFLIY